MKQKLPVKKCAKCGKWFGRSIGKMGGKRQSIVSFNQRRCCSLKCSAIIRERSEYTREKRSLSVMGDKNHMWKGDKVSRNELHGWVKRHILKAKLCEDCGMVPPYDLANISQKYKRDFSDWEWLCRRCHMMKDGRLERLVTRNKTRRVVDTKP